MAHFLNWARSLELDETDKEDVRKKTEDIRFRWEQVKKSVHNRKTLTELYYQFHKQAVQVIKLEYICLGQSVY